MEAQHTVDSKSSKRNNDLRTGLIYLAIDICASVAAQMVLKSAMADLGAFEANAGLGEYLLNMINLKVILGLGLYGIATVLWILCLSKLDLSFAYPVAVMQYLLIFGGAWYLFGEEISLMRVLGMLVIMGGVIILSRDKQLS